MVKNVFSHKNMEFEKQKQIYKNSKLGRKKYISGGKFLVAKKQAKYNGR